MIGRLRGEVLERGPSWLVVDVGGVGYLVSVTLLETARIGERVDLFIHTAVRDDAIALYGFSSRAEKELFDLLIGVPGVGPVKAMGILQTPVATFIELVQRREPARLSRLPGVGKKTAERILVDLADKIAAIGPKEGPSMASRPPAPVEPGLLADLLSALVNLGFKEASARETAEASLEALGEDASLEALLRDALQRSRPKG